jgi:hypothetical protein
MVELIDMIDENTRKEERKRFCFCHARWVIFRNLCTPAKPPCESFQAGRVNGTIKKETLVQPPRASFYA